MRLLVSTSPLLILHAALRNLTIWQYRSQSISEVIKKKCFFSACGSYLLHGWEQAQWRVHYGRPVVLSGAFQSSLPKLCLCRMPFLTECLDRAAFAVWLPSRREYCTLTFVLLCRRALPRSLPPRSDLSNGVREDAKAVHLCASAPVSTLELQIGRFASFTRNLPFLNWLLLASAAIIGERSGQCEHTSIVISFPNKVWGERERVDGRRSLCKRNVRERNIRELEEREMQEIYRNAARPRGELRVT